MNKQQTLTENQNAWLTAAELYAKAGDYFSKSKKMDESYKCYKAAADIVECIAQDFEEKLAQ